jgi:hypothetical protein
MLRSVIAIAAGFAFITVLAVGTDAALHAAGVYPAPDQPVLDTGLLLLRLGYVTVYAVAGCYLAARLAPDRPMWHALVLGGCGVLANAFDVAMTWGRVPVWFAVAMTAFPLLYAWIGGRIREWELARGAGRVAVS